MTTAVTEICDPDLYRLNDAIQHAGQNVRDFPGFETDLTRFLQAQCLSHRVPLPTVFRGLDVLGGMLDSGVLDETRLTTLLKPFLGSSDPRIASKSVLVLGRRPRTVTWLNRLMRETDDRVRANLIESIWTRKEPEVEIVLRSAARDRCPRVAANAVYGLFLIGVDAWMEGIDRLIGSDDAGFRRSGIWMLKSSDAPGAAARLKLLIRDADSDVRRAAFNALIHLREHGSKKTAAAEVPSAIA